MGYLNKKSSNSTKMKFTKIVLLSGFCVVLASIQMSATESPVAEDESRAVEDAYANYQQYYQQYAEQQPHQPQVKPFGIQNKQDFTSDIKAMLGPDAGIVVGGAGLAVGLLALIGLAMQNVEFRGVCSATKALGNTALTSTATSSFLVTNIDATLQGQLVTEFNNIVTAINNIATPDCTS